MIRKAVRIRIYTAFLTLSYCAGFSFLLWKQGRAYQRRFDRLEESFNDRVAKFESSGSSSSSVSSTTVPDMSASSANIPRFIVLGHGRSSRWGYLDIQYVCDGTVDRFFYNMDTIRSIPDDIERELFRHENGLVPPRFQERSSNDSFNGRSLNDVILTDSSL